MVSSAATTAAFLSTGIISLAPNVILLIFPKYAAGEGGQSSLLSIGQAMSAGALLGDVFLHSLEEAAAADTGSWILIGFTVFLAVDMLIRSVNDSGSSHSHEKISSAKRDDKDGHENHHHHVSPNVSNPSAAILNLAADSLHNFTDGLAIGTSYALIARNVEATSVQTLLMSRGGLASISILLHEVPHELGDFCTLLRAGFSTRQAILAQFSTAVAAFVGTAVALSVSSNLEGAGDLLLSVTAGGFVYLAATTLLPEVLQEDKPAGFRLLQLVSFILGVLFQYGIAGLEDEDHHHHHHHHHESHDHGHHHHEL